MADCLCCICGCDLDYDSRRRTLNAQIKYKKLTSSDVLTSLGIEMTPCKAKQFLICPECSKLLTKLVKTKEEFFEKKSKLNKISKTHTCIGFEIKRALEHDEEGSVSPQSSPKRRKISSTPLKRDSTTQTKTGSKKRKDCFLPQAASHLAAGRYKKCLDGMKSSKTFNNLIMESVCKQIQNEMKSNESIFTIDPQNKTKSFESYSWKAAHRSLKKKCPTLMTILESTLDRKSSKKDDVRLTMTAAHLFFIRRPVKHKVLQELIGLLLWFSGSNRKTFLRLNRLGLCTDIKTTKKTMDSMRTEFDATIRQQQQRITELQSTNQEAKRALSSDEWVDLNEWEKVLEVTDTTTDHVVISQTDTVPDATDTPMEPCDDSDVARHIVISVSQTGTVLEATVTPMNPCEDSHVTRQVVVSQTDTVPEATDTPMEPCSDSHVAHEVVVSVSQTGTDPAAPDTPMDHNPHPDNHDGSTPNLDETIPHGQTDDPTATPLGFTLTFGNVKQREGKGNKPLKLVQSYGEIDRVPCFHLSDEAPSVEQLSDIGEDVFLPSTEDIDMLRDEYEIVIARILSNNIPCFQDMGITEHMPHPYHAETKKKSVMVPLGVLEKDVSIVSDMIDVLSYLHKYVPGTKSPIPVVLYGDQLSCENVCDAIGARSNEDTQWDRLSGLLPSVQEWHKRLLLLEDTYKLLYDAKSTRSCGSMSFIRSRYRHTNVTPNVSQCFNSATSLLRFATEAHVVAAACEFMGVSKPSDTPKDLPEEPKAKSSYFSDMCKSVLQLSFHPYRVGHSNNRDKTSEEGEARERGGEDLEEDEQHRKDRGKQKNRQKTGVDSKFEYSKALLHLGLGEMVRHDAIQEGDGNRMIQHWCLDLPHFYDKQHWKYLMEGHNLIMNVNGGVSERIAHQLKWNRTVNILGGEGKNMEKDLGMEFMNKDYIDSTKVASGNLVEGDISRYSQVAFGKKALNRLFDTKVTGRKAFQRKPEVQFRETDTATLAELLVKNKCLVKIPGRSHAGFEDFAFEQTLDLDKYKAKMTTLSKKRIKRAKAAELME